QAAGTPRRQIERGACQCERVVSRGEAFDQLAVEQRAYQSRHEWRRSRNGKDAGNRHDELYSAGRSPRETYYPCTRPMARTASLTRLMSASQKVAKSGPLR